MQPAGFLICFEGGDRCGKTTQLNAIYDYLLAKHVNVLRFKHPNRNDATGKLIDSFLKKEINIPNECMTLLLTANLWDN